MSSSPVRRPATKSRDTRSTLLLNIRKNERYGMYSPNGAGCCLL